MQFTKSFKTRIAAGDITVSYRTWRKPQVKVDGRYNIPPFGAIEVTALERTSLRQAKATQIRASGFADREAIAAFLKIDLNQQVFEVTLRFLGTTPVKQPTTSALSSGEMQTVREKLNRIDRNAGAGAAWTYQPLIEINKHAGTRAGDLAPKFGMDTPTFKRNIRKLKALGLTHSLDVGYKLSERGQQILQSNQEHPQ